MKSLKYVVFLYLVFIYFRCDCQHGQTECELNSLMNCAMEKLVQPRLYIPLIGCIQGSDDIDSAAVKCLKIHPDKDW